MVKSTCPFFTSSPSENATFSRMPPTWGLTSTVFAASTLPMALISTGVVFTWRLGDAHRHRRGPAVTPGPAVPAVSALAAGEG